MTTADKIVAAAYALLLTAGITTIAIATADSRDGTRPEIVDDRILEPCAEEDSLNCHWDADKGNGLGRSFVNIEGRIHYFGEELK